MVSRRLAAKIFAPSCHHGSSSQAASQVWPERLRTDSTQPAGPAWRETPHFITGCDGARKKGGAANPSLITASARSHSLTHFHYPTAYTPVWLRPVTLTASLSLYYQTFLQTPFPIVPIARYALLCRACGRPSLTNPRLSLVRSAPVGRQRCDLSSRGLQRGVGTCSRWETWQTDLMPPL